MESQSKLNDGWTFYTPPCAILDVFSAFRKLDVKDNNTKIQDSIGLIKLRCMLAFLIGDKMESSERSERENF